MCGRRRRYVHARACYTRVSPRTCVCVCVCVDAETLGGARQYARYDRDKSEIARQVRADLWDVYRVLIFSARARARAPGYAAG